MSGLVCAKDFCIYHTIKAHCLYLSNSIKSTETRSNAPSRAFYFTTQPLMVTNLGTRIIRVLFFVSEAKCDLPSGIIKSAIQKTLCAQESNNSPTAALSIARSVSTSLCGATPLTRQFPIIEARHSSREVSFTVPWTSPVAPSLCQHAATHLLVSTLISDHFFFISRMFSELGSIRCCSDTRCH